MFISTPNALSETPLIETSKEEVSGTVTVAQLSSSTEENLNLEISVKYACPDLQGSDFSGIAQLTMTLRFEDCEEIAISWDKSCGRDYTSKCFRLVTIFR